MSPTLRRRLHRGSTSTSIARSTSCIAAARPSWRFRSCSSRLPSRAGRAAGRIPLMLLLGIAGCIWLTGVRWVRRGGDWDLVFRVAVWGVGFGIIGARLYHDVTSWSEVKAIDAWWAPLAVWKGGLGVWGGILFGCIAGAVVVHRSGNSVFRFMDAVAPGLLLAQGIGRIGNWWNQELFGKPTGHSWGLEIAPEHRPLEYLDKATF